MIKYGILLINTMKIGFKLNITENGVKVGTPYVKGCKVEGTVTNNGKAKKILVYRYKAKKNERRTQGHRQPYTKVEIKSIVVG